MIFEDNYIHDNDWHGMHVGGRCIVVKDNLFERNHEAHLFASMVQTNVFQGDFLSTCEDIRVEGNHMYDVRRRDISAHAMEIEGFGVHITDNHIDGADHGGIALTRGRNVIVSGNLIKNLTRIAGVGWGGIDMASSTASALGTLREPSNITITKNHVYDDAGTGTRHAVRIFGGTPINNLEIRDNDFSQGTWLYTENGQPHPFQFVDALWIRENSCYTDNKDGSSDIQVIEDSFTGTNTMGYDFLFPPRRITLHFGSDGAVSTTDMDFRTEDIAQRSYGNGQCSFSTTDFFRLRTDTGTTFANAINPVVNDRRIGFFASVPNGETVDVQIIAEF